MRWFPRVSHPDVAGKLNLSVMSTAFAIFGLSLIFQPHRWASTPAYHILLLIFAAQIWGGLFLASSAAMAAAAWQFGRRWAVIAALTLAFTLTTGWMLSFIVRYLSSPNTTPETWVSWAVFGFLLLKVAAGLDRPRAVADAADTGEILALRQAIDDALTTAVADQQATLARDVEIGSDRLRDSVSAACAAYAQALHAIIPAGGMPGGDPARVALVEARSALLRAEEAYARATGQSAQQVPPSSKGGGPDPGVPGRHAGPS